jgi:hypothetical protein
MIYKIVLTNQKKINISQEEYEKVREVLTRDRSKFLEIHGILVNPSYIVQVERDSEAEAEEERNKYPDSLRSGEKDLKPISEAFLDKWGKECKKIITKKISNEET